MQDLTLDNFDGWDASEDLFSKVETSEDNPDIENEVNEEDDLIMGAADEVDLNEEEEDPVEKPKKGEKKEVDLFSKVDSESDEEEEEEEYEDSSDSIKSLREAGLLGEDEEAPENMSEFLKEKFPEKVKEAISEMFEELPEAVKQLNRYVLEGGDVNEFLDHLDEIRNESSGITPDMDLSEVSNQKKVMVAKLKKEGFDDEYIDAQVEFWETGGMLEKLSKKELEKVKENDKVRLKAIADAREAQVREEKEQAKKQKMQVSEYLKDKTHIGDLDIPTKFKNEIPSYISDKTVKLKNGSYITEFQRDFLNDMQNNQDLLLQLAILYKNKKGDTLDFSSIVRNTTTKETRKFRNEVKRSGDKVPKGSDNSQRGTKKALWEHFVK